MNLYLTKFKLKINKMKKGLLLQYLKRLKYVDFFGVGISFKIKNYPKYRSQFGGLIFVLFFIVSFYYAALSAQDFWNRKIMNLIFIQKYIFPNPSINFATEEFNLGFQLVYDGNGTVINTETQKFIYEKANLVTIKNSDPSNKYRTPLNLRECTNGDFYNKQNESYTNMAKTSILKCINESNISVEGAYELPLYTYLDYGVYLRKEYITNQQNVTNLEFIKDYFIKNRIRILIWYIDSSLDIEKLNDPISHFFGTLIFFLDINMISKVNVDFTTNVLGDDHDILLGNNHDSSYIKYEISSPYSYFINDRTIVEDDPDLIAKFYFRSSSRVTVVKRKYQKISDYLANIGSLISNLFFLLWIIISYVNKFSVRQKIMNKSLKFKDYFQSQNRKAVFEVFKTFADECDTFNMKIKEKSGNQIEYYKDIKNLDEDHIRKNSISKLKKYESQNVSLNKSYQNYTINEDREELKDKKIKYDLLTNNFIYDKRFHHSKSLVHGQKDVLGSHSKKPLNFNPFHSLKNIVCCTNLRSKVQKHILKKAEHKLDYYLDIQTYINKMQEVDLIKEIFFNPYQQKIFDFISIPSIYLTTNNKILELKNIKQKPEKAYNIEKDHIESMINCYHHLKPIPGLANSRLLKLFELEIKYLIA
jgi:hypothetical protein